VSPGGVVIVDDYGSVPSCKQAVHDFRQKRGIAEPMQGIDGIGVYWIKAGGPVEAVALPGEGAPVMAVRGTDLSTVAAGVVDKAIALAARGVLGIGDLIGVAGRLASFGQTAPAITLYRTWLAHTRSPSAHAIWYNLGQLLNAVQDFAGAEQAFRNAVALTPRFDQARLALGLELERQGRIDEALGVWREGVLPEALASFAEAPPEKKGPFLQLLAQSARVLAAAGRLREAETMFDRMVTTDSSQTAAIANWQRLRRHRWQAVGRTEADIPTSRLLQVHFDIVGGCQLSCVGCPNTTLRRSVKMIEPEVFRRCLNNLDVDSISFFRCFNYGEPLLHKNLTEIMAVLADFRAGPVRMDFIELSTNAQHADWPQFEAVLSSGVLDRLVVSCDGDGTPEKYERLRPPARWDKLIRFLERVAEIRSRRSLPLHLMTRTIIERAEDQEAWEAVLRPIGWTPEFRRWFNLPGAPENRTGHALQPGTGLCKFLAPFRLFVDWDGTVVPCCAHPRAAELGSLTTDRLSTILRSETRQAFIDTMMTDRSTLSVCKECEY
jgi:radical SAM protein with 4Fe4S-binding SPASM domain